MKKILVIVLLLIPLSVESNVQWQTRTKDHSISFSDVYDAGFYAGARCVIKELKGYIDSEMSEEELILRINQCKYECTKEYFDSFVKDMTLHYSLIIIF